MCGEEREVEFGDGFEMRENGSVGGGGGGVGGGWGSFRREQGSSVAPPGLCYAVAYEL